VGQDGSDELLAGFRLEPEAIDIQLLRSQRRPGAASAAIVSVARTRLGPSAFTAPTLMPGGPSTMTFVAPPRPLSPPSSTATV
jgi:hypothetical protein